MIFRFNTHSIEDLCFKFKKEYATKVKQTGGEERREEEEVDGARVGGAGRKEGGYKG